MPQTFSLYEAFGQVPDPRDASGRRHPLQAILTLASVAMLSGARSLYAIAQFGRDRGEEFARALGFTRDVPPCCATLHYLFAALDRRAFERAIRRWTDQQAGRKDWQAVSLDGKTLRGTQGHEMPGGRAPAGRVRPRGQAGARSDPGRRQDQRAQGRVGTAGRDPAGGQAGDRRRDVLPA
jgi:hypothetical protein